MITGVGSILASARCVGASSVRTHAGFGVTGPQNIPFSGIRSCQQWEELASLLVCWIHPRCSIKYNIILGEGSFPKISYEGSIPHPLWSATHLLVSRPHHTLAYMSSSCPARALWGPGHALLLAQHSPLDTCACMWPSKCVYIGERGEGLGSALTSMYVYTFAHVCSSLQHTYPMPV